jgi:hypothetical protein
MAGYLEGKVAVVIGPGNDAHRGVAVALAQAGADIAIGGIAPDLSAEAALHSISNAIWALNRRSTVVILPADNPTAFAETILTATHQLGRADLTVRCDTIANA